MAILKAVGPRADHVCKTPNNPETQYGIGTVWECNECGKQARLDRDRDGYVWVWMLRIEYLPSKRSKQT